MSSISTITTVEGDVYDIRASGIPYGHCDSTSTSTAFTATVPGVTSLHDGVCALIKNGVVTSAEGCTLNINGLGAKPLYSSMSAATRVTTMFSVNYTILVVYDETRVSGGCWVVYYGYYTSTNSIGYQVRTNSTVRNTTDAFRYYKILFSSPDNTKWVPAASSTANSATSAKTVNQRPINPFGEIVYCSGTTSYAANAAISATSIWQQYTLTLGYSFNRTGAALVLTTKKPVYVKCAPQSDGSAIIDADTPYVQDLPSTADGKIYIWLGIAYSTTQIELTINHPIFYYKDGAIRLWTNVPPVDTSNLLTKTDEKVWFEINTVVPAEEGGDSEAVIGIVDSSGNRVGVDEIAAAYKKSRDVIIYYYPPRSNGEICGSLEISRISNIDTVSKTIEIVSYYTEGFRHMTFAESDNETVLIDSHELYIGDITDLSTVLTTDSYVKLFEIVQENGNTYIYDYYEGINVDFYGLMAVESSRGAIIRYGSTNCFVTATDYYYTTAVISYIDAVNGQKRLHEMLFENDFNNNVMVMQSETITIIPTKTSDLQNDSGFITGMAIMSYGSSTWNDFLTAYRANKVVYCRASSNSNPASGSQTRLAFMAYVDNADNPGSVEFQYYRSVSSHTNAQQGDQVYVYKLESNGTWSVTVREAYTKIVAGTGLSSSYSNGVLTLSLDLPTWQGGSY